MNCLASPTIGLTMTQSFQLYSGGHWTQIAIPIRLLSHGQSAVWGSVLFQMTPPDLFELVARPAQILGEKKQALALHG